jgi:hypothetical protein
LQAGFAVIAAPEVLSMLAYVHVPPAMGAKSRASDHGDSANGRISRGFEFRFDASFRIAAKPQIAQEENSRACVIVVSNVAFRRRKPQFSWWGTGVDRRESGTAC